jgi:peptide/nickel transport system permease protein
MLGVAAFFSASPGAAVGAVIVLGLVGLALATPEFHAKAYNLDLIERLQPPRWSHDGTAAHLLGTDTLGRDVFARIVTAVRVSLMIAGGAVLLAGIFGVLLGMLAGYFGGWLDDLIMRVTDAVLAIPIVLFALSVIAVLGPSVQKLILVIAFSQWMIYARTARAETLVLREQPFVVAAHAIGARPFEILRRHILPHLLPSALALGTLNVSAAVLIEAGLSYLGLGVQPPDPSLGSMLSEGQQYIERASWLAIYPGLALFLLVLGVNLLGDGLRSYFDPQVRMRGGRP